MRGRDEFFYNPLDFEEDVAIGLVLPMSNDAQAVAKYNVQPSASAAGTGSLVDDQGLHPKETAVQGGFTLSYTTKEQAKSNIRNLVVTNKGERVMHPEFGCDIYRSLFEPITPSLINGMKKNIERQTAIWLSYINLLDVNIKQTAPDVNRVNIEIWYALYSDTINKEMVTMNNIGAL